MKPIIVSLVTCMDVREHPTKALDLFGVFDSIWSAKYPASFGNMFVMVEAAEVRMKTRLSLELVASDPLQKVIAGKKVMDVEPDSRDPLACQRFSVMLPNVTIPSPGVYFMQVVLAGVPLQKRRLNAHLIQSGR